MLSDLVYSFPYMQCDWTVKFLCSIYGTHGLTKIPLEHKNHLTSFYKHMRFYGYSMKSILSNVNYEIKNRSIAF